MSRATHLGVLTLNFDQGKQDFSGSSEIGRKVSLQEAFYSL